MRSKRFPKFGAVVVSMLVAGAIAAPVSQASHQTVAGLTTQNPSRLVFFTPGHPENVIEQDIDFGGATVNLVGIDYRPRANLLYGYSNTGNLYALRPDPNDLDEYDATLINPSGTAPAGSTFGFDFNPVADAGRLVADSGANYVVNADNGQSSQETDVDYPAAAPFDPPSIDAIAYSNSYPNMGTTTLYGIDTASTNNRLVTIASDGTASPVGDLGLDVTSAAGFDILTSFGTPTPQNTGYASLTPDGAPASNFYFVDLATGAATLTSTQPIGGGSRIESVALPLTPSVKFANGATQAGEGNVFVQVTVERHGRNDRVPSTVDFSTSIEPGDTAEAADFTPVSGTLTFPPGVNSQSFSVPINDDNLDEDLETFQVNLGASSNSMLVSAVNSVAKVLIIDNDDSTPAAAKLQPLLSVPAQSVRQAARGTKASFSCNAACNASLSLFAGKKKLSGKTASLAVGGVRNIRFALTRADRNVIANRITARGVKLTVKGVFRRPNGGAVVRRSLTFRAHL